MSEDSDIAGAFGHSTKRVLAAAGSAAAKAGIETIPQLLSAGSNFMVRLAPEPLVARVMTGTVVLHDDPKTWLEREVAIGAFAAERGGPVVAPSSDVSPGPYLEDGLWLTIWEYVEVVPDTPPLGGADYGRLLRDLHEAMAGFTGELDSLVVMADSIARAASESRISGNVPIEDVEFLEEGLERLRPVVFDVPAPGQAIHGDASFSNLLQTTSGPLWNDFEDVCRGPIEWDVGGIVQNAMWEGRSDEFIADLLLAYGGPELGDLQDFIDAQILFEKSWMAATA